MMRVHRFTSAADFLALAERALLAAEVENNLILGLAYALATRGPAAGGLAPYFAAVTDEAATVVMCAFRTLPGKVGVTRAFHPDAPRPLADDVWHTCPDAESVIGPRPTVDVFAREFASVSRTVAAPHTNQRLYELRAVAPLARRASGRLRVARADEAARLVEWATAFFAAIREPGDADGFVRSHLADGSLVVWDDDGIVAMAAAAGRTAQAARIGFVYTPPDRRGRGYATALVAALSQHLLDEGRSRCCLYTDLANPTSNAIYQRLGYTPVCDVGRYTFTTAPPGLPGSEDQSSTEDTVKTKGSLFTPRRARG
jgi:GNAT superfamily N-acetyltransferase